MIIYVHHYCQPLLTTLKDFNKMKKLNKISLQVVKGEAFESASPQVEVLM